MIDTNSMQPFLAGIFAGTLFWVGVRWITTVLPCMFMLDALELPLIINRDHTERLLPQPNVCSILRPHILFLLLHYDS